MCVVQAERVVLHTDDQGALIEQPLLAPNATIEAIFLIEPTGESAEVKRTPAPVIAGQGCILGDIISPAVDSGEWDAAQ